MDLYILLKYESIFHHISRQEIQIMELYVPQHIVSTNASDTRSWGDEMCSHVH